jgi:hypothetical protein
MYVFFAHPVLILTNLVFLSFGEANFVMSDPNRRALNPNADSFVPNAGAAPFVPGQQYQYMPPQQQFYAPPPVNFPGGAPFYQPNMPYAPNFPPPHMPVQQPQQFQAQHQQAQQPQPAPAISQTTAECKFGALSEIGK